MSTDVFQNLRTILLGEEQDRLHRLEEEIARLREQLQDKERLIETIQPVISDSLSRKIRESRDEMAQTLAPVMGAAIKKQIAEARDDVVDALYPVIGQTIRRSVAEAMKKLVQSVNERLDRALSMRTLRVKIRAKLTGVSAEELLLKEAVPFEIREIFLIHKESGLLISHVSGSTEEPGESEDVISGMLTAIRDFARTAFSGEETRDLSIIQYEDLQIYLESGRYAYLAIVVTGVPPADFADRARMLEERLHRKFHKLLRTFEGESGPLQAVKPYLREFRQSFPPSTPEKPEPSGKFPYPVFALIVLIIFVVGLFILPGKWQEKKIRDQIGTLRRENPLFQKISPDIRVTGSTVLLAGQVAHWAEKEQLVKLVRNLPGVDSVINRLRIIPENFDFEDLRRKLRRSLGEKIISDVSGLRFIVNREMLVLEGPVLRQADKLLIGQWVARHSPLPLVVNDLTVVDSLSAWQRIVETNIYFKKNSATLPENQVSRLKTVAAILRSLPFRQLFIVGFADGTGTTEVNRKLALRRARTIKEFLIRSGIDSTRLQAVGMGEKFPLAPGRTPRERELNRRVCFRFELGGRNNG